MTLQVKATSGVKWTGLSTIISLGLQFIKLPIVARLLQPSDFGLMAMVTVVVGFAQTFSDMGISNAIIHHQDTTKKELSSLYWLNIFAGVLVFTTLVSISPIIVQFYEQESLKLLLFLGSLNFLIIPIGQQFQILFQKELEFERIAKIEIVTAILSSIVTITSAYLGHGVFALIWGQLSNSICKACLLTGLGWKSWHPKLYFNKADIDKYLSFGLYQMGERSINYFSANVDYLIIGKFLSPEILGLYTFAYQLVTLPLSRINPILTKVAFPIFSKKQKENFFLQKGYLSIVKILSFIVFPILIMLAVSAPLIIPNIFGDQWTPAIPLIQVLAILGIVKTMGNPGGSIVLAKGRADIGFKWNLFVATSNLLLFLIVAKYGVYYIAWSYTAITVLHFILGYRIIIYQTIKLGYRKFLSSIIKSSLFSACMGIVVHISMNYLQKIEINNILTVVLMALIGIFTYGILWIVFEFEYIHYLYKLFTKKKTN